jgi:hypothetical protein
MQVEELFDLTNWVQKEIVTPGIITLYQNLLAVLNQNSQPSQAKLPFEEQKQALFSALKAVQLSDLSSEQLELLKTIGIANNVANEGVSSIEDILFRNVIDIATTINKITASIAELNSGVEWATQVKASLTTIINEDVVREASDGVLMRVHFQKDAHLSNLTEFKDWGKNWYDIGRGIAMANGAAPEDVKVVGASKGSIIITLLTTYSIAKTTSAIILEALKVAEKIYDIKKAAQEVRALKIGNDAAEKALEKDAQTTKESGVTEIIANAIKSIGLDKTNDGDKVTALESSVKKLVDFIEKGGEVDFVVPDEVSDEANNDNDANSKAREELRVTFREVRLLEKKIHQIEFKKDE